MCAQVVCLEYCDYDVSGCELTALTRYLDNASTQDEFRYTCPPDSEILMAYRLVAKYQRSKDAGRRSLKKPGACT